MKKPIGQRQVVINALVSRDISCNQAANLLGVSRRSIERYRKAYLDKGIEGLKDLRHSNYRKLSNGQRQRIINLKNEDRWRSARNVRDRLDLAVCPRSVAKVFKDAGLSRENIKRIKAIQRFEAESPNDLWQTDIMGKIDFANIGILYLIATLDDHSRFVLAGRWFKTQGKMNVFAVWYESLSRWGLPKAMLQDEGSQYKARTRFGQADYGWYAQALKIKLIWAKRAQTKGKIERFWKFVQGDFVHEVLKAKTADEVNGQFKIWLAKYNYKFKSEYFGKVTRASRYQPSQRHANKVELETLLVVEERRKVSRESTISLYGKHYYVPPGYIGCRIWIKVIGNRLHFEAMGETFWKTRLKID